MKPEITNMDFCLSHKQKEQIVKWWLPGVISRLKHRYQTSCIYMSGVLSGGYQLDWFYIGSKTCFPLFAGKEALGVLILSSLLDYFEAEKTRKFINQILQDSLNSMEMNSPVSRKKVAFPILIRQHTEEDVLKLAHDLYLQSSDVAFLTGDELQWTENVFKKMDGIFLCIPSFHKLSNIQKDILLNNLSHLRSSSVVLGICTNEELPSEIKDTFHHYSLEL